MNDFQGVDMSEATCNRCNRPLVGRQTKFCSHQCANNYHARQHSAERASAPWAICSVEGCSKPSRSRVADMCPKHYHRVYRYGTLERTTDLVAQGLRESSNPPQHKSGMRVGTLTLVRRSRYGWLAQCSCGETRIVSAGEINRTAERNTCGNKANHLSDDVDYSAAHGRVRKERGKASRYPCVDCGARAKHWSYDHADPDERTSSVERTMGLAFSLNIEHYQPRCVPCHKRYDLAHINGTVFSHVWTV